VCRRWITTRLSEWASRLPGDRRGGWGCIAVTMITLIRPGATCRIASALQPGRVFQANEPGEDEILFPGGRGSIAAPAGRCRKRQHSQALLGHGFLGGKNLLARLGVEWAMSPSASIWLHRGRTVSSAPLAVERGTLRHRMHGGEPHAVRVKRNLVQPSIGRKPGHGALRHFDQRDLHGSPRKRVAPCSSVSWRSWHRRAVRKKGW